MKTIALLFPGQGSQYAGMGRALADAYPAVADVFQQADEVLGIPLSGLCFSGPEDDLKLTANTQPAILTTAIAALQALRAAGVQAQYAAGHSLGEYAAIVSAGALPFVDAVRLVRLRGQLMQSAVPVGQGAMAALLNLDPEQVERICAEAAQGEVCSPANFNSPGQIVIAGHAGAVTRAQELASAAGGRAIPLAVSAPFHCALMQPAQDGLAPSLRQASFQDAHIPVITNVDAEPASGAEALRSALVRQVTAPVRWEQSMRKLIELGVDMFVEVGPGKVLAGLMRRIDRGRKVLNVEDPASLDATLQALNG